MRLGTSGLMVPVALGRGDQRVQAEAQIDTGAEVDFCIPRSLVDRIPGAVSAGMQALELPNGARVRVQVVELDLTVGEELLSIRALVVPGLGDRCLIGLRLVERLQRNPVIADVLGLLTPETQLGLTLYFSTKLAPVDRFLIDAIIYGTLGFDTDCEVVQFEQREDSAVVRLQAADPVDLVAVADTLYDRVWEMQDRAQTAALQRLDKVFQLNVMGAAIGSMADQVERMELRLTEEIAQRLVDLLGPYAIEMLRDQGAKHIQEKDSKLVMTWSQKGGKALGRSLVKKITGGVSKEIEGEVKALVKALDDDEDAK